MQFLCADCWFVSARVDTGYDVDRSPGKAILSESILNYKLYPPWVEESAPDWEIVIYLRIERHYEYEMAKVVFPLFCVVVSTGAASSRAGPKGHPAPLGLAIP